MNVKKLFKTLIPNKLLKRLPNFIEQCCFLLAYKLLNIDNKISPVPICRYIFTLLLYISVTPTPDSGKTTDPQCIITSQLKCQISVKYAKANIS